MRIDATHDISDSHEWLTGGIRTADGGGISVDGEILEVIQQHLPAHVDLFSLWVQKHLVFACDDRCARDVAQKPRTGVHIGRRTPADHSG